MTVEDVVFAGIILIVIVVFWTLNQKPDRKEDPDGE